MEDRSGYAYSTEPMTEPYIARVCEKAIVTLGVLRPPNPVEKSCIPHRFTGTLQKAGRVSAASMAAMPFGFAYRPYWAFVCAHDALGLLVEPELTELGCRADAAS